MSGVQDQESSFLVDLSARPWVSPPIYAGYDLADCRRIEAGLKAMLTAAYPKTHLLVPLAPRPDGTRYYASITRADRIVDMVQFRVDLRHNHTGLARIRPIEVSGSVRAAYPHIIFLDRTPSDDDGDALFWRVLRKAWGSVLDAILLLSPQRVASAGAVFRYNSYVMPSLNLNPTEFNPHFEERIQIAARELCAPDGKHGSMLVFSRTDKECVVALIRDGATVNAVYITVVMYPELSVVERQVIFPPDMGVRFPGMQFTSTNLTDAQWDALFQQPVLRHYRALTDGFVARHYHIPRFRVLAMCLHHRPTGREGLGRLGNELVALIARMTL